MQEGSSSQARKAIEHCELFGFLDAEQRADVAARCVERRVAAGSLLIREGDTGDEAYVLIEGTLEVFTDALEGDVVLARLDQAGAHVGEQALSEGFDGRRTASLRAVSDVTLAVISRETFTEAMRLNPDLAEHVAETGRRQARQLDLVERSVMYRALASFDQAAGWSRDETYADGEVVFREGDPGEAVYVIRSGDARVTRAEDGRERVLAVLHAGQTFGELAVMAGESRQATVTADGPLEVVAFDRRSFLQATGASSELHDYLGTLKRIYAMGDGVATQFDGEFRGAPAVVTLIRLDADHEAVVHHARGLYSASIQVEDEETPEEVRYEDPRRNILRILGHRGGVLRQVHVEGPWSELDRVHAALVDRSVLKTSRLESFAASGHLFETAPRLDLSGPEALLCQCMRVARKDLESVLAKGAETLEQVADATGAGSVCGACSGRIGAMLGSVGQPVALAEMVEAGRDVRSFRFQPTGTGEPLRAALPGQHVIISAEIDGHWVHRPYTISSASGRTDVREITVKREPHGFLSGWLFDAPENPDLRLSHPRGEFWADLERRDPVVCLVAGIGMTPALAMARSLIDAGHETPLHIDYSARTESDLVYRDELDRLVREHSHISVRYRITGRSERLDDAALEALVASHPGARYYICGPDAFQHAAQAGLERSGVTDDAIQVERFTPVGHAPTDESAVRTRGDRTRAGALLGLSGLYLLQDAIGWQPGPLVELQDNLWWGSLTGLALVAYMAFQWMLGVRRLQGRLPEAARHYAWHRLVGVATPVLLYLHSANLGYVLTATLGLAWLFNGVVGAFDKAVIADPGRRQRYHRTWLPLHVGLSCLIVVLTAIHAWVALVYK